MSDDQGEARVVPAFTTGGGGFSFEDRVGTWVLSAMLAGHTPIGSLGVPKVIEFQQKEPPTALDDVVVTGADETLRGPRWFASIKSFDLLGTPSALENFVAGAWAQILGDDFDPEHDFVGFVCGQARDEDWTSLLELIETVRNDTPERMSERIAVAGAFNETDRRLWEAFKCPEELAASHGVDVASSPSLLLRRLIPLHLDFRSADSRSETEARQWCEQALAAGHAERAGDLYRAALELVSRTRPSGGSIDWGRIADEIGGQFTLDLRSDAEPDWVLLDQHTRERVDAVNDTLAEGVHLPRADASSKLSATVGPFIYLTGPSGCGKTALAKAWLAEADGSRLWLTPRDLAEGLLEFKRRLNLRLPLADVLTLGRVPVRVVIDGLDHAYDTEAAAAVAALARLASGSAGRIQVLVTSQTFGLERVARSIQSANGPSSETAVMEDLDDADIRIALEERPDLQRLVFQGELRKALRRPKMLQVVFQALDATSDEALSQVRDEASVADLWWDRLALGDSPDRASRIEFLRGLAEWTAGQLAEGLPAGALGSAGLGDYVGVVDPLRAAEVLAPSEDMYAFAHDLLADWTRYKSLGPWDDARAAMGERELLPPWHRATRLYALHTLTAGGTERWLDQHEELRGAGNQIAADLYLDAPLFAPDPESHIAVLWPTLIAKDGELLVRMLKRFAHVATFPNRLGALISEGGDPQLQAYMAATWRVPVWVLWPPVIRALADRVDESVRAAPVQVATIADNWLRQAPDGSAGREEAARLGFAVGDLLETAYEDGRYFDEDDKIKLCEAFLAAAAELPVEVTSAAMEALRPTDGEEVEDL